MSHWPLFTRFYTEWDLRVRKCGYVLGNSVRVIGYVLWGFHYVLDGVFAHLLQMLSVMQVRSLPPVLSDSLQREVVVSFREESVAAGGPQRLAGLPKGWKGEWPIGQGARKAMEMVHETCRIAKSIRTDELYSRLIS